MGLDVRRIALLLLACALSCDSFGPDAEAIERSRFVGVHEATTIEGRAMGSLVLLLADGAASLEMMERGAYARLALGPEGVSEGRIFVPFDFGEHIDLDLAGRWRVEGGVVRFEGGADPRLDRLAFRYQHQRLVARLELGPGAFLLIELARIYLR